MGYNILFSNVKEGEERIKRRWKNLCSFFNKVRSIEVSSTINTIVYEICMITTVLKKKHWLAFTTSGGRWSHRMIYSSFSKLAVRRHMSRSRVRRGLSNRPTPEEMEEQNERKYTRGDTIRRCTFDDTRHTELPPSSDVATPGVVAARNVSRRRSANLVSTAGQRPNSLM